MKSNRRNNRIWWIIFVVLFLAVVIFVFHFFWFFQNSNKNPNETQPIKTWSSFETGLVEEKFIQKTIVENFSLIKKEPLPQDFPQIIFKKISEIKNPVLVFEVSFTEDFIQNYQYENSENFFFALKVFLWDFSNGGYFAVFRKQNGWVANSQRDWLEWAKSAKKVNDGVRWEIPLFEDFPVAVESDERTASFQYKFFNFRDFIFQNSNKPVSIGGYLSSTKEVKWRNLMKIESMTIKYFWPPDAVEIKN